MGRGRDYVRFRDCSAFLGRPTPECIILGQAQCSRIEEPRAMQADADRDGEGPRYPPGPAEALFHLEKLDAMLGQGVAERGGHRPSVQMLVSSSGGASAPET